MPRSIRPKEKVEVIFCDDDGIKRKVVGRILYTEEPNVTVVWRWFRKIVIPTSSIKNFRLVKCNCGQSGCTINKKWWQRGIG